MSNNTEAKKCLECQGAMQQIRVIDHAAGGVQAELAYASLEKTPSWFTSYFKEKGRLIAFMCTQCGAVRFYGESLEK